MKRNVVDNTNINFIDTKRSLKIIDQPPPAPFKNTPAKTAPPLPAKEPLREKFNKFISSKPAVITSPPKPAVVSPPKPAVVTPPPKPIVSAPPMTHEEFKNQEIQTGPYGSRVIALPSIRRPPTPAIQPVEEQPPAFVPDSEDQSLTQFFDLNNTKKDSINIDTKKEIEALKEKLATDFEPYMDRELKGARLIADRVKKLEKTIADSEASIAQMKEELAQIKKSAEIHHSLQWSNFEELEAIKCKIDSLLK